MISRKKFEELKDRHSKLVAKDLSETDTRSKLIDFIFIDVLGWGEEDIQREGNVESGYYDYRFSIPSFKFVVEAKKQRIEFKLPKNNSRASWKSLRKENKSVLTQIRNYAMDMGITHGIITNGEQFIIGRLINTDGTPWEQNKCAIFDGLPSVESRFIEFYNTLSKQNVISNAGFGFNQVEKSRDFETIISTLIDRDQEIVRNQLGIQFAPIIDKVFGEMFNDDDGFNDNTEFLRECFVENNEIKKNRSIIERLFSDSPPSLEKVIPVQNTNSMVKQISEEIQNLPINIRGEKAPKPIIIVGSKGAGKTTFIRYLFSRGESDRKMAMSDYPHIYIDFRKYFDHERKFNSLKIIEDILEMLFEKYDSLELDSLKVLKRIYFKEINRNDKSIWERFYKKDEDKYSEKLESFFEDKLKDKSSHLTLLSQYMIRDRRKRLVFIIDNADQYSIAVQESVFLFANSLNKTAKCGVVISLREGYYYSWRNRPPFDAFDSNVYHVTAPNYGTVLQKRLKYSIKSVKSRFTIKEEPDRPEEESNIHQVFEFLSTLRGSVFNVENSQIIDFLSYTTYPNIRKGLAVFKSFLTSGYTNVDEYVMRERFSTNSKPTVPFHEFIKAVGLGNKLYYQHNISRITNILCPTGNSRDHFIQVRILQFLSRKLLEDSNSPKEEVFSEILKLFCELGYGVKQVQEEIITLLKAELIGTEKTISDIEWSELPGTDFNLSITAKGEYYLKELLPSFEYLDLILQDTPIFESNQFNEIKAVFPKANPEGKRFLFDRIRAVKYFIKYLTDEEKTEGRACINQFGSIIQKIWDGKLNEQIRSLEGITEN